jgi:hypothetical protein
MKNICLLGLIICACFPAISFASCCIDNSDFQMMNDSLTGLKDINVVSWCKAMNEKKLNKEDLKYIESLNDKIRKEYLGKTIVPMLNSNKFNATSYQEIIKNLLVSVLEFHIYISKSEVGWKVDKVLLCLKQNVKALRNESHVFSITTWCAESDGKNEKEPDAKILSLQLELIKKFMDSVKKSGKY